VENKKILVTGAKGLVGSSIDADIKIGREFDLTKPDSVNEMMRIHQPTHIVHCAGKVGGLGANMNHKGSFFYDNIMMNTNIIESSKNFNVKKLVCFLSTCIFPDNAIYPLTENQIHSGPPHFSNDAYAYAKRMADIQIRAYREEFGTNYVSVIPTNIYGPNDNFSLTNGHVVPMLIHKLYLAKKENKDLVVWGSGKAMREFIFSKDIAKLTNWALNYYEEEEPIIFSNSEEISIRDLVDLLVKEFSFKNKVIFDSTKPDGQLRKPSDNSKLKKYLPDFKFTTLEEGMSETVNWFIENYEKIRK